MNTYSPLKTAILALFCIQTLLAQNYDVTVRNRFENPGNPREEHDKWVLDESDEYNSSQSASVSAGNHTLRTRLPIYGGGTEVIQGIFHRFSRWEDNWSISGFSMDANITTNKEFDSYLDATKNGLLKISLEGDDFEGNFLQFRDPWYIVLNQQTGLYEQNYIPVNAFRTLDLGNDQGNLSKSAYGGILQGREPAGGNPNIPYYSLKSPLYLHTNYSNETIRWKRPHTWRVGLCRFQRAKRRFIG